MPLLPQQAPVGCQNLPCPRRTRQCRTRTAHTDDAGDALARRKRTVCAGSASILPRHMLREPALRPLQNALTPKPHSSSVATRASLTRITSSRSYARNGAVSTALRLPSIQKMGYRFCLRIYLPRPVLLSSAGVRRSRGMTFDEFAAALRSWTGHEVEVFHHAGDESGGFKLDGELETIEIGFDGAGDRSLVHSFADSHLQDGKAPTSSWARSPSATRISSCTSAAWRSWRVELQRGSGFPRKTWKRCGRPRSFTTWARSQGVVR